MSYENTDCPCGGKKERETMICPACREYLAGNHDLHFMADITESVESRRRSAVTVLSLCRKRNRRLPLRFAM